MGSDPVDDVIASAEASIRTAEARKLTPSFDGYAGLQRICDSDRWEEAGLVRLRAASVRHTDSNTATHHNEGGDGDRSTLATTPIPMTPHVLVHTHNQELSHDQAQQQDSATHMAAGPDGHGSSGTDPNTPPHQPPSPYLFTTNHQDNILHQHKPHQSPTTTPAATLPVPAHIQWDKRDALPVDDTDDYQDDVHVGMNNDSSTDWLAAYVLPADTQHNILPPSSNTPPANADAHATLSNNAVDTIQLGQQDAAGAGTASSKGVTGTAAAPKAGAVAHKPLTPHQLQRAILRQAVVSAKVEIHNQLDWVDDLPSAPTAKVPPKPPRNK